MPGVRCSNFHVFVYFLFSQMGDYPHGDPVLQQHLDGGGEPGAGDRFRLAGWLAVRLGCGVSVKTFFVFISFDLMLLSQG